MDSIDSLDFLALHSQYVSPARDSRKMESLALLVSTLLLFSHVKSNYGSVDQIQLTPGEYLDHSTAPSSSSDNKADHTTIIPSTSSSDTRTTQPMSIPTGCRLVDWVIDLRGARMSRNRTIIAPRTVNIGACAGHCSPTDFRSTRGRLGRSSLSRLASLPSCSRGDSCNICPSCQPDRLHMKPLTILYSSGTSVSLRRIRNVRATRCSCEV